MGKFPKRAALLVWILLAVCTSVGGTVAFLMDTHGEVENVFTPTKVTTSVEETLTGAVKSNVRIKNTGSTQAYIRAAVVVTWQDEDGNIHHKAPAAGTDYDITFDLTGWKKGSDGFYYWLQPVDPGHTTGVLIASCSPKGTAPQGYYLNVEVLGSGIQSKPSHAVTGAWSAVEKVLDDGTLTVKGGAGA